MALSLAKVLLCVAETPETSRSRYVFASFSTFRLDTICADVTITLSLLGLFSVPAPLFGPSWAVQRGFYL